MSEISRYGYADGNLVGCAEAAPKRKAEIPSALTRLDHEINLIGDRLKNLEERLNTVMRPSEPQPGIKEQGLQTAPSSVPLVSYLEEQTRMAASMVTWIESIVNRIEL